MKNLFRISGAITVFILSAIIFYSCTKNSLPIVTTTTITGINETGAISGGNITNDGGIDIIEKGVCWNTSMNPKIGNSKTTEGGGIGTFVSNILGLQPTTIYYVRAYATNAVGTGYGNELIFNTLAYTPTVTTSQVINFTANSASIGGNIISDGGAAVTSRGVCWSWKQTYPTTDDFITSDGTGIGGFASSLTGLTAHTIYDVRAYATNSRGTGYGDNVEFTTAKESTDNDIIFNLNITYGALSDVDGQTYKTVQIGSQIWMAENLRTTKYNDSSSISLYSWYNNDISNKNIYGALYSGYAVITGKLCPTGWHVPTDAEWETLIAYTGGANNGALKLKEIGTIHWLGPNTWTTNETGFTALPGGFSFNDMTFFGYIEVTGSWWTSTESDNYLYSYDMNYMYPYYDEVHSGRGEKGAGFSVRCIKN
jgi:uncharacterized protein (TIGR02145 family)